MTTRIVAICLANIYLPSLHRNCRSASALQRWSDASLSNRCATVVINVANVVAIVRESAEPRTIQINSQRRMASDQNIDAHIKLLMPNQQRVVDVALNDVGLGLVGGIRPLADLTD